MATITITIPDAQVTRVLDGFCAAYGWDAEFGVPKAAFAKQKVAEHVRSIVLGYERALLDAAALAAVVAPDVTVT